MKSKKNLLLLVFVNVCGMYTDSDRLHLVSEQTLERDVHELKELLSEVMLHQRESLDQIQKQIKELSPIEDDSFIKAQISIDLEELKNAKNKVLDGERERKMKLYSLKEKNKKNVQTTSSQEKQVFKMQSELEVGQEELERLKVQRMLKLIEEKTRIQNTIERKLQEDFEELEPDRKERIARQIMGQWLQEMLAEQMQLALQGLERTEQQKRLALERAERAEREGLGLERATRNVFDHSTDLDLYS